MALAWKKRLRTWELETEVTGLSGEAAIQQRGKEAVEAKPTSERKAGHKNRERQQRTLACCPTPAQVFSQQLPNQHAIIYFKYFLHLKYFENILLP
jgi:hypothetical protein